MMPYSENGVTVHFPNEDYFFLSECEAYDKLKSFGVKEMDVCWLDKASNVLWMVELKAFDHAENVHFRQVDLSSKDVIEYWLNELFLKSVHTLGMIETNRSGTKKCLIPGIALDTEYKIVHIINVMHGQEEYLSFMKDRLQSQLEPYIKIFNVDSISIIPYNSAKNQKLLKWII
ncbi:MULTISPECIES: hypothetical protein [Sphingobacterium]|uniref:Uncharacterized protein n=1 Tax=Sphingobacterium kyonggiense TaxID=714075 RepID=A0ABP7Z0N6_9SPHI|nr:hypothetical protein [Sphingobacterium hotanense]MCT1525081.1 hypothetical protein [Sphingobacterium hotanense]